MAESTELERKIDRLLNEPLPQESFSIRDWIPGSTCWKLRRAILAALTAAEGRSDG